LSVTTSAPPHQPTPEELAVSSLLGMSPHAVVSQSTASSTAPAAAAPASVFNGFNYGPPPIED
jgi:hypothetical protein